MSDWSGKKIGIIGGTGFIGGKIKEYGVFEECELILFSREKGKAEREVPGEGLLDFSELSAVINLAGEAVDGRWNEKKKQSIRESRLKITRQVVASLAAMSEEERPKVLLNASATGYYGDRGNEILTEEVAPGDDFLAKVCVDWEIEAMRARALGVRVVCLRTGVILGEDGKAWKQLERVFRLGIGGKLGDSQQWFPWIHARDEVAAIAFCMKNESVTGPVNLTAPGVLTNEEFTKKMAEACHRPAIFTVPAFALRLALGEFAGALLGSARVTPKALSESGFAFKFPELTAALSDLRS